MGLLKDSLNQGDLHRKTLFEESFSKVLNSLSKTELNNVVLKYLAPTFSTGRDTSPESIMSNHKMLLDLEDEGAESLYDVIGFLKLRIPPKFEIEVLGTVTRNLDPSDPNLFNMAVSRMFASIDRDIEEYQAEGSYLIYLINSKNFKDVNYKRIPFANLIVF